MFRTACILAAVALCAATAPPRIELNLAEFNREVHTGDLTSTSESHGSYFGARKALDATINTGNGQGHRADHSRMDFVEKCEADTGATYPAKDCLLPKAKVYDYLDTEKANNNIDITSTYCQVDDDKEAVNCIKQPLGSASSLADLKRQHNRPGDAAGEKRGSYLFTYDAKDAAGNHAQQVVFVLIVNDETAPKINIAPQHWDSELEVGHDAKPLSIAGYRHMTCVDPQGLDLPIGQELVANKGPAGAGKGQALEMTVTTLGENTYNFAACHDVVGETCSDKWDNVKPSDVGQKLRFKVTCHDYAGFYGAGGANNTISRTVRAMVKDTTPPTIYPKLMTSGETTFKKNHKGQTGTVDHKDLYDSSKQSKANQDARGDATPWDHDDGETLECDFSIDTSAETALPWVTLRNNHLTDTTLIKDAKAEPIGTFFSKTQCRDDRFFKNDNLANAADYYKDALCQVKDASGNWVGCETESVYENDVLTASGACARGVAKCLQPGKFSIDEKCTDGQARAAKDVEGNNLVKNVRKNHRMVKVVDDTPPTVNMQYKDWTATWRKNADKKDSEEGAGIKKATFGDGKSTIRTFKISNEGFANKCGADSKTTNGFDATECEGFIHDRTGAKGKFFCKAGKKGKSHSNPTECSIATTNVAGMTLSEQAEGSFTDQCDNGLLYTNAGKNIDMKWMAMNGKGEIVECAKGASCQLDTNAKNVGIYHLQYTVKDRAGNSNSITFPIQMTDDEAPVIHMEGCSSTRCKKSEGNECTCAVRLQASNTVEYTDYGAQCHDYVDGVLSHAVEVSGQVVNMRVPDTYVIQYDCADLSGNAAVSVRREVFVEDTDAPTLTLDTAKSQGPHILFVEAGFPYADAGATMSDSLDGVCVTHTNSANKDMDGLIVCNQNNAYGSTTISGDTVDVFNNYYEKTSCADIKRRLPDAKSGRYVISPHGPHRIRQIVSCFMPLGMTFRIFHHTNVPSCEHELGTGAMLINDAIDQGKIALGDAETALDTSTTYSWDEVKAIIGRSSSSSTEHDHEFACVQFGIPTYNKDLYNQAAWTANSTHAFNQNTDTAYVANQLKRGENTNGKSAEAGVYKIIYDGNDVAGNHAAKIYRTVIVKDTLPPVISLLNPVTNEILASGSNAALGLNGKSTPVPKYNLMAETASVNGWFIGAVACAVSGVALLATSMKKTATSVPV
jgi:hypothetical protein